MEMLDSQKPSSSEEEKNPKITFEEAPIINSDSDDDEEEEEGPYYDSDKTEEQSSIQDCINDEELEEEDVMEVLYNEDGHAITDEDLLYEMQQDHRLSDQEKLNLLPKIRRYLNSITKSKGFEVRHHPGNILGFPTYSPRQHLIHQRHRYPEGYNHLMYMSNLALKEYNKIAETEYEVLAIEEVNTTRSKVINYNLTFTASWDGKCQTFRARVVDDVIEAELIPTYCKIKKGSSMRPSLPSPSDKLLEEDRPDPIQLISNLHSLPRTEQFNLIDNDRLSVKEKIKLVKKVRKYFKSVVDSEGFKCSYFPGNMARIPALKPRDKIIHEVNSYPECYRHLKLMAKLALDHFYQGTEHNYVATNVEHANMFKESDCSYVYYVTFIVKESPDSFFDSFFAKDWEASDDSISRFAICPSSTFEAKVRDIQHDIEVLLCREACSP